MDYCVLNKATIPDKYMILVITELLDELYGAKYLSKLDQKSGYHQIQVSEPDVPKMAFHTHFGHYEFVVMPHTLATFQATMNELFRPYLRQFVLVFFDDILIYSRTQADHLQHVQIVMQLLVQHQF